MRFLQILFFFFTTALGAQTQFEKGERFFQQGNLGQAKLAFKSVLDNNPNDLKVLEYLGDIECYDLNWSTALEYYKKLKNLKPSEANYFYKYGGALGMKAKESNKFKALGMIDDIEDSFKKAIKLDVKHIGARWALIELYLQLPALFGGSEKKAQDYAAQLLKISDVDGYLSKGHIAEYFERYTEAEKNYKKAIEIGGSKTTYQKLADLYKNKMKLPEKAKATLEEYSEKAKHKKTI